MNHLVCKVDWEAERGQQEAGEHHEEAELSVRRPRWRPRLWTRWWTRWWRRRETVKSQ